jgi:hypothetical protein
MAMARLYRRDGFVLHQDILFPDWNSDGRQAGLELLLTDSRMKELRLIRSNGVNENSAARHFVGCFQSRRRGNSGPKGASLIRPSKLPLASNWTSLEFALITPKEWATLSATLIQPLATHRGGSATD